MLQSLVQEKRKSGMKAIVQGIEYEICECCGKPKRGTGKSLGGIAIWVLKDFIRAKKRIDFTGQWQSLCESCGFETIEIIRAWLVEERGTQYDLKGEAHTKIVERKSFFRRLYENKARAAKFWLSVLRSEQAAYLWQAHAQLWHEYKTKMGSPKPSNIRPTRARVTSAAHSMAYKDAGEPNVETDTQIDYEIVLVTRKSDNPLPLIVPKSY